MLGDTKKSALGRQSAKLPKLSVQQQVQNHEIAQRMNRKVAFTRNPRHLTQTISYAQAMTGEAGQARFRVEPAQLYFGDYDTHHVYEAELKLVNISKHTQRIKLTPLTQREFVIASVKYPREDSGDIAPGLAVTVAVRFRPASLADCLDELIVIVGEGTLKVPIIARRERCEVGWPKSVQCGHCWVGDRIKKEVQLKNKGGDAIFTLKESQTGSAFKKGYFKISPIELRFQRDGSQALTVEFSPEAQGVFKEEITFATAQGDQEEVKIILEGGAYSAQIVLEELGGQKAQQKRTQHTLHLQQTQPGSPANATLKVRNLAVVQVDYFWHFTAPGLTITSQKGKMKPSELLPFTLTFTPSSPQPQVAVLELFLYNLPQKSLVGEVVARNIGGIEAIQCLRLEILTKPKPSELEVFPLHRRIVQPIYQGCSVTEPLTLANRSSVSRAYKIEKIKQDRGLLADCLLSEGTIQPNSEISINLRFQLQGLSAQSKAAHFLVRWENGEGQCVSLEGNSTFPTLELGDELVHFGLCRTFTLVRKPFTLRNSQLCPVFFRIHNPYRFYVLDFYDFYDFEDESSYRRRVGFFLPDGRQAQGWFSVPPKSELRLEVCLNAQEQQSLRLQVQVQVRDGPTSVLSVVAEIQDVRLALSRTSINLRDIYKGNIYNSNKFLAKQLQIVNPGNLPCAFQIDAPPPGHCDIRIQPLKGLLEPKQVQRLDLIVEPVQTGNFDLRIGWRHYDPFKANPDLYPDLTTHTTYDAAAGSRVLIKNGELRVEGTVKGMAMNYYLRDEARARKVRVKVEEGGQSVKLSASSLNASMRSAKSLLENEKIVYPLLEELNFYNCEINQVRQQQIIIENDSGLTTEFQVEAELFHTLEPPAQNVKQTRGLVKVEEEAFTSQMGKTFIKNRLLERSQKVHLGNNKGVSVLCEPNGGTLHKKQSQRVLITMFNDSSGRFQDHLLIKVKNHETKRIPIDIHVTGTPVALSRSQLGIDFTRALPLLHLGALLPHNGLARKTIKIVNNGPKQVQLKWLVYPLGQKDPTRDLFQLSMRPALPGSNDIVDINWEALKPDVDKQSVLNIEPNIRMLSGREEAVFTVLIQELQQTGSFGNLLVCEPTIVEGSQRRSMEVLAVEVRGEAVEPKLTLDVKHSNHVNKLERFAVSHEQAQTNSNNHQRKIKLKNTLVTNLAFELQLENSQPPAFSLVHTSTNSPAPLLATKTVQQSFLLTPGSYLQATVELKADPRVAAQWPLQQKLRREGQLLVRFGNGRQQKVELVGWLYRPWAQILMPNDQLHSGQNCQIDFGQVHVKNSRKMGVFLINPSKADARWSISYIKYHQSIKYKFEQSLCTALDLEDQTITDQKKVWRLSSDSGVLRARTLPVHYMPSTLALPSQDDQYAQTHKPALLQIMFKPQAAVLYKSKFRLTVEEGLTFDIIVKGKGTFAEELEKK